MGGNFKRNPKLISGKTTVEVHDKKDILQRSLNKLLDSWGSFEQFS